MGLIRRSVHNPVAANMLMVLLLAGGLISAFAIPRELFPEFSVDRISITVPYPGAAPAEVEEGICLKIEEQLAGLEDVEDISSTSQYGAGTVLLELRSGAPVAKVLDDVKGQVDRIDFPPDAEDPIAVELTIRQHVIHVAIAGDAPERTLKELAEEVRDEINDLPGISQVSVSGVRGYEIAVEIDEETLQRHRLTLGKVAQAIRQSSFDLPAGTIKTRGGELSIRIVGQRHKAKEFEDVPVLTRRDGTVVTLGEIATVVEGFEDVNIGGQFNGRPAALVSVFKTGDEDTIDIVRAIKDYVERKRPQLPEGIEMEPWADMSKLIYDRLDMLIRNGRQGLGLVFLILWIFLGFRLAFWVAMGIPVSLMATLLVLNVSGMTLNMMSMFALIMTLGLIVDDAIVVGENVHAQIERGADPASAAVSGTQAVLLPVIGAVTTTCLAFMPLLFIPGIMGRFLKILPLTVILALTFSLVECLIILPPHLAHSLARQARRHARPAGRFGRHARAIRSRLDRAVQWSIHDMYLPVYRLAVRHRYVTAAGFLGIGLVVATAVRTGHVRITAFEKLDSDTLVASLILPTGTSFERTGQTARRIARAAGQLNAQYPSADGEPIVQRVYSLLGQTSGFGADSGSHIAQVFVELRPTETRTVRGQELMERWRANTGPVPEALSLTYSALRGGPGGKSLEVRLLGPSIDALKPAADELKDRLITFQGVSDIEDDALPGKMEMKVRLKPGAPALGVTLADVAEQMRNAFWGKESVKVQRGREEIKVMVRFPEQRRRTLGEVERMRIRTAAGDEVPFGEVVDVALARGYTTLRRVARRAVIAVSADVDHKVANAEQILRQLQDSGFFADLEARYPGMRVDLRGQRRQVFESLNALMVSFPLALLGIYTILAGIFKSYLQPAIIMVAIPFGLVGAAIGHILFGFDLTLMSLFGMVALTGIVVNDALVLLDRVNTKVRAGAGVLVAVEGAAGERFRPILLTTVTTVCGMAPIMAESSFQALFLKPMVVSLAAGLVFATMLTLVLVPCLYLMGNDVRRAIRWLKTGALPAADDVVPRPPLGPAEAEPKP